MSSRTFFLCLIAWWPLALVAQNQEALIEQGQALLDQYIAHYQADEYAEAKVDMDAGIALLEGQGIDTLLGKFYNLYSYYHFMQGDKTSAFNSQKRAAELFQRGYGEHESTAFALFNLAYLWKNVFGNVDSSAVALQSSIQIYKALDMPLDVAECYRSIGQDYANVWEYQKAEEAYLKGIEIFEALPTEHPEIFEEYTSRSVRTQAWSYYNLAIVYGQLEDRRQALIYMQRSQELLDAYAPNYPELAIEARVNRTRFLQFQGDHFGAIAALEATLDDPAIEQESPGYRTDVLAEIAAIYAGSLKDYKQGAERYRLLIEEELVQSTMGRSRLLGYMRELIKCYLNLADIDQAKYWIDQARQIAEEVGIADQQPLLQVYAAKVAQLEGNCAEGLQLLNPAIEALVENPNPSLGRLWRLRSELQLCLYEESADPDLLAQSLHWSLADIELLEQFEDREFQRRSYGSRFRYAVEQQLEVRAAEYAAYGQDSSLQIIFQLLDQSRGRSLRMGNKWERESRSLHFSADLVQDWETSQRLQLQLLNKQYQLQRRGGDSLELHQLTDSLTQLTIRLEALQREMQSQHPLDLASTDLTSLQSQLPADNAALVIYFLGDSSLTAMAITPSETAYAFQEIAAAEREQWQELQEAVSQQATAATLGPLLHQAYAQLLAPVLSQLSNMPTTLYLVPDGLLSQLPWAAFCSELPQGDDFRNWPYLIKQAELHFLAYAGELTSWQNRAGSSAEVACFAPHYPANPKLNDELAVEALMRDGLWSLPGAAQEVDQIASLYGADGLLLSTDLSKTDFRERARQFDVLHLAMHALADPIDPSQSYLLFPPDSLVDDRLTALELLSDRLQTDLVVLSACYSGEGPWRAGEGVMSLAYALRQSGVQSVLSNSWAVADQFSAALMVDFHQGVRSGLPLVSALNEAQRTYLETATPVQSAHPFYWAGFQLQGNPLPVYRQGWSWWWALLPISLIVLFLFRRRMFH